MSNSTNPSTSRGSRFTGLVAATHTPFHDDGSLNLAVVEIQATHLLANKVHTAFICGSTGESHSLTVDERRTLAQRWSEVTRGSELRVVVHVGSNCLSDAAALARHAAQTGAVAVSALAPSYFKPRSVSTLVDCCAQIASAAPETPFYFYDIPVLTGVNLSMPEFLDAARERIPNLAGLKFTNPDLMSYQLCLRANGGAFDCPWGIDEALLGALAMGAAGAVGSTYNFASSIYHRLMEAFARSDLASAREEQFRSVQLVQLLAGFGYMGAAKSLMQMLGVNVGAPRLPNAALAGEQQRALRPALEELGFFDWVKRS